MSSTTKLTNALISSTAGILFLWLAWGKIYGPEGAIKLYETSGDRAAASEEDPYLKKFAI